MVKGLQTKKVVTQSQTKEGGNAAADDEGGIDGNADSLKLGKVDECPVVKASDGQLEATERREDGGSLSSKFALSSTRGEGKCMSSLLSSLQPMERFCWSC